MRVLLARVALAVVTAVWCFQPFRAHAADMAAPERHAQVDALFEAWDGPATPGCAIAIAKDGVLDHARGYGMANLEHDIPITPRSVFLAASISKQFTAFSVLLLAQEGKLSLSDDIRRYVPEIPDYGRPITIAHLLHHTNGLREQGQLLNFAGWRGDDLYTEADIVWALRRQPRLNFEPGTEIVYGNAAYTLLGMIVQRVSGQPLREFAASRIFTPLGMTDTWFRNDPSQLVPRRATAYRPRAGGGWSESVPPIAHYGSTGLYTTVGDLLKWQQNLLDARVGGPALIAAMRKSGTLNDGVEVGYGGGLRLGDYRGLRTVSHDGADGGYRAEAVLFPDQRLAVVVLCNGLTLDPTGLTRRIADLYLADQMTRPALAPALASDPKSSALAGTYWSPTTGEVVQLGWVDGALRQAGSPTPFVATGPGTFRPQDQPHEWRFVPPPAGAPQGAPPQLHIRDSWPTFRVFERITSPRPSGDGLNGFVGRYHSDDTDMTYTVRLVDGRLQLSWPRDYAVALDAVGGDHFVGARGTVTFVRTAAGDISGLTVSNRRLRRLFAARVGAACGGS